MAILNRGNHGYRIGSAVTSHGVVEAMWWRVYIKKKGNATPAFDERTFYSTFNAKKYKAKVKRLAFSETACIYIKGCKGMALARSRETAKSTELKRQRRRPNTRRCVYI